MPRLSKLLFGLVLCLWASAATAQDRPKIIVANTALQYFAERLVEGDADVIFPVPDVVDPSFWRPSIADISLVQSADLILLNGAGFATWVDRVSLPRSRLVNTTSAVEDQFIVTESITHSHGDGGEHSHEGVASYTWLDPQLAIAQAEAVAGAIAARNLAAPDEVYARFADLRAELTALEATTQDALKDAKGVAIIATHPRYQYFARRFSLSITSLEWEAGAMPNEDQLAELKRLATESGARVLIWEAKPLNDAFNATEALGLQNVVFEPWAGKSTVASFVEAYTNAVLSLSQALRQSQN